MFEGEEEAKEMGEEESRKRVTSTSTCAILAIDHNDMFYRVCAVCESPISNSNPTFVCHCHSSNPSSKRLFRILMSVATDTQVLTVVCFDRVARILFGCSADEFFHFSKLNPFSGVTVNEILEGEMFTMTLSKSKNMNAQHMRVASAVPLSSTFQPAIHFLKQRYQSTPPS